MKSGFAQGSVLGPLYFIIFINDLPKCVMSKCFGYAGDDHKNVATNLITLQVDALRMWKWLNNNLMKLNVSICKVLIFKGNTNSILNGALLIK